MASNPKMEYQVFLCIFQKNSAMATLKSLINKQGGYAVFLVLSKYSFMGLQSTLGLKEMEKFLWEDREKGLPCWLSQFSKTKTGRTLGIMKSGLDAMPLLLLDDMLWHHE
jgi:hypothetical protein